MACTTESPFQGLDGTLYQQKDGLAMGSPLSCVIANFYLCHIENEIMEDAALKPSLYGRFIDDCFVEVRDMDHLAALQREFIRKSSLNFTNEVSIQNKIPFLDVLVEAADSRYNSTVFTKPTKSPDCINYKCEAPEKYKTGVIITLLERAWKICNPKTKFKDETLRIKRLLVNNDFPNRLCDKYIESFLNRKARQDNDSISIRPHGDANPDAVNGVNGQSSGSSDEVRTSASEPKPTVTLYYRSQYSSNYKVEKAALRRILKNNIFEVNVNLKVLIYYKSKNKKKYLIC